MPTPYIGFENRFNEGVVSVTHEDANFPKENAIDWLSYSSYKMATASATVYYSVHLGYGDSANYVGIGAHNLGSKGATVVLQYNAGAGWVNCHTPITPSNDNTIFIPFTQVTAEDFRLAVTSINYDTAIGILAAGDRLEVPRGVQVGWMPPILDSYDVRANWSEENTTLGRSVVTRFPEVDLAFTGFTETFVRNSWITFLEHAKAKPFFFAWNYANRPTEVALMHVNTLIELPSYVSKKYMGHKMTCRVDK